MQNYKFIITNNISDHLEYLLNITQTYKYIKIFVCKNDVRYRIICSDTDNFGEFTNNYNYIDITDEFL